jgi:hypothetical protein
MFNQVQTSSISNVITLRIHFFQLKLHTVGMRGEGGLTKDPQANFHNTLLKLTIRQLNGISCVYPIVGFFWLTAIN